MKMARITEKYRWIWAAIGTVFVWLGIIIFSEKISSQTVVQICYTASFLIIVSFGQMCIFSSGRGAIDLSIPGMITLAAYLNQSIIGANNAMVLPGLLIILAISVLVGLFNSLIVVKFKLIPMIATMAV